MTELLLCSNNQLLIKSLYGMLRDEGYSVETADHPALAVKMVLKKEYTALIIDSEPFGLSVDDAIKIIRTILPGMIVIFIGYDRIDSDALSIEAPLDLAEFKQTIHDLRHLRYAHKNLKGGMYGTKRNRTEGV
jgi:DNA-binding NtrC family response regulator